MIWAKLRSIYSWLPESSEGWHQHAKGGGWVRNGVEVSPEVYVGLNSVFCGGEFCGGVFYGGEFHGGEFHDGVFRGGVFRGGVFYCGEFHGGEFYGGVFYGGEFHGGEFRDGVFRGGVFSEGVFYGGVFYGGEFYDGEFYGGEFHDGVFYATPLQIGGWLPWFANIAGPNLIQIGCECHTLSEWDTKLSALVRLHHAKEWEATIRNDVLPLFRAWFAANPNALTVNATRG